MADDTAKTPAHGEAFAPTFRVGFLSVTPRYDEDPTETEEGTTSLLSDPDAVEVATEVSAGAVFVYVRDPAAPAPQPVEEYVLDEKGRAYRTKSDEDPTPDRKKPLILAPGQAREFWHSHTPLKKLVKAAEEARKLAAAKAAEVAEPKKEAEAPPPSSAKPGKKSKAKAKAPKKETKADKEKRAKLEDAAEDAAAESERALAESIPSWEKREAAEVITIKSCVALADQYEHNKDGIILYRTHDSYFYRGHLATDVDGAKNSYGPTVSDLAYLRGHLKRPRKPKKGETQYSIPGYADSYDDKGNLRKDFDSKTGYLKERAKPAEKIRFVRGDDKVTLVTSDHPSIQPERNSNGTLKMGIADGLASALYHAPNKSDKEHPKWDGIQSDNQGRPFVNVDGPHKGYFVPKSGAPIDPMLLPAISVPPYNKATGRTKLTPAKGKRFISETKGDIVLVSCIPREGRTIKSAFAYVYECGGSTTGEGTPKLKQMLGMYGDKDMSKFMTLKEYAQGGGSSYRFAYLIFRHSTPREKASDLTPEILAEQGAKIFETWGGLARLRCCFPELFYAEVHVNPGAKPARKKAAKKAAKKK